MNRYQDKELPEVLDSETSSQRNEQANIHYSRNKKIIFWGYLFFAVLLISAQIYLVITNWNFLQQFSVSDNFYYANQITVQWQEGFIEDILVTDQTDCPNNYDHAFTFTWPGTGFGCYCEADKNNTFVLQGYCSPALIQFNCTNIANYWVNGSNICIRRSSVSFATEEKYDNNNKICGSSNSLVIIPSNKPCPIVNLTFDVPTLQDHYDTVSDTEDLLNTLYTTFNATSPYSFYSYPLSKFTVSEYEFCMLDEDSGLNPAHSEFILLDIVRGCAEQGNYTNLNTLLQTQFYSNNQNLNDLANNSGFPKPGNWQYHLGFANYPSWTYQCRHLYDGKFSMPNALKIFNFQDYDGFNIISIICLIALIILAVEVFILSLRRALKKQVYPVGYKQMYLPLDFCCAIVRYIIDFVCKLIILALSIYMSWKSYQYWNWFKAATNLNCADNNREIVDFAMNPYVQLYENCLIYSIGLLALVVVFIAFDIIHFCYIYHNQLHYYLVNPRYSNLVLQQNDTKQYDDFVKEKDSLKQKQNFMIEDIGNEDKTQGFRVTVNVFQKEETHDVYQERGRKLKNKKKKFGKKEREQLRREQSSLQITDDFNPYNLNEESIIPLDSKETLKKKDDFEIDQEELVRSRRKNRGRGRKR